MPEPAGRLPGVTAGARRKLSSLSMKKRQEEGSHVSPRVCCHDARMVKLEQLCKEPVFPKRLPPSNSGWCV